MLVPTVKKYPADMQLQRELDASQTLLCVTMAGYRSFLRPSTVSVLCPLGGNPRAGGGVAHRGPASVRRPRGSVASRDGWKMARLAVQGSRLIPGI